MQTMRSYSDAEVVAAVAGRVSVVIPAFNASAYIAAAIQSATSQSARPVEVIVVDDGSTDDTIALARSCGASVISVPNGGPSAARNVGVEAATGDYIAFLDADDIWTEDKLVRQFAAHMTYGYPAFSFTDYRIIDAKGVHPRLSELRAHPAFRKIARRKRLGRHVLLVPDERRPLLYGSYIPPSSILVRRTDYLAVGGFDKGLRVTEDFEFYLRLLRIVPAIAVMEPLLFYRRHDGQATADAPRMLAGYFDVAERVLSEPDRYPLGDAHYMTRTSYARYYLYGMKQARLGQLDEAAKSFRRSLHERWTFRVAFVLAVTQTCCSGIGRTVFMAARALWKRRPGQR